MKFKFLPILATFELLSRQCKTGYAPLILELREDKPYPFPALFSHVELKESPQSAVILCSSHFYLQVFELRHFGAPKEGIR